MTVDRCVESGEHYDYSSSAKHHGIGNPTTQGLRTPKRFTSVQQPSFYATAPRLH